MTTYTNLDNTRIANTSITNNLLVLFFGWIGLAIIGLWKHAIIYIALCILATLLQPYGLLFITVVHIAYTFSANSLLESALKSEGWKVCHSDGSVLQKDRTKTCPYCAEEIKYNAVVCKHCHKDV